jgi:hypothetical protein
LSAVVAEEAEAETLVLQKAADLAVVAVVQVNLFTLQLLQLLLER